METEVVVIGAGVVGCSIAFALAQAGISSHNVDALPAPGYGSTSHSSAIIRPFYSHPTACAVAHQSRCHWLRWGDRVSPGLFGGGIGIFLYLLANPTMLS